MADKVKDVPLIEDKRDYTGLPKTPTVLVGVYGTLKRTYCRHDSLGQGKEYVGEMPVQGIMFHEYEFPMVAIPPMDYAFRTLTSINCQVYRIATTQLWVLDAVEGHPDFYRRVLVQPAETELFKEGVWVYFAADPAHYFKKDQRVIPKGVWFGPQTKYVNVDFGDGTKKPKIILGKRHIYSHDIDKFTNTTLIEGCVVDASTCEVESFNAPSPPTPNPPVTTSQYPGIVKVVHRDYITKEWRNGVYYNEKGQELAYCQKEKDHVVKGSEWSEYRMWEEAQKNLVPKVFTVPDGPDLTSCLNPKTASL
jgi:gamma-glutamylcyclotransferase (GGCT)/AIG2-like uncharacterized protein YtfP